MASYGAGYMATYAYLEGLGVTMSKTDAAKKEVLNEYGLSMDISYGGMNAQFSTTMDTKDSGVGNPICLRLSQVSKKASSSSSTTLTPSYSVVSSSSQFAYYAADGNYTIYLSTYNYNVNNSWATFLIKIQGLPNFYLYIGSYAESNYDYTVAFSIDTAPPSSLPAYNSTGAIANTKGNQKSVSISTVTSNMTKVSYTNDGKEHNIYVVYRKDSSTHSNADRGYVAIRAAASLY